MSNIIIDCTRNLSVFSSHHADELLIQQIKQHNHVYEIQAAGQTFFLKFYTKDWYSTDPLETAGCVRHEVSAWDILRVHDIAAPEVFTAEYGCDNPLERPFVITRKLRGTSFTTLLKQAGIEEFKELCFAVGEYMRQMHAIAFVYPGYLLSVSGPSVPPNKDAWQHFIWTFFAWKKMAKEELANVRSTLPPELMRAIDQHVSQFVDQLKTANEPPRFTHGDCHAHQFYLYKDSNMWQVSGVVDMECASAGYCGADWLKLMIEMASNFPASSTWWEYMFEGYGVQPNYELIKLDFLIADEIGLKVHAWPGTREEIARHLLSAKSWRELFDLKGIRYL